MQPALRRIPSRRGQLGRWLALLIAGFSVACAPPAPPPPAAPGRVVLITIDTLRADHVGALGGEFPTPALDSLAVEGVLVAQATTPVPSTGPAHASLFTGLYPWRHGTLRNAVPMDGRIQTVAEHAQAARIRTAAFVSSFILHRRFGFDQGFDTYTFEPTEAYQWRGEDRAGFFSLGETTSAAAMHWLTAHHADPFLLWVHYFDPHRPYEPPSEFADAPDASVDLSHKRMPLGGGTRRDLADAIRGYRGEVRYVDAQVGRLVEQLRILGVLDDTLVIVTSDHGEGLGDHKVLEHGVNVFDELVRVPLIARGPGLPAGRRLDGAAQLEDLAPTMLAALGLAVPDGLDGHDLGPWLRGETDASPRRYALGRRRPYKNQPDLFYVRRHPEKWQGALDGPGVVFDLAGDPRELAGSPGEGAPPVLREVLVRDASKRTLPRAVDPAPEVQRALEALGYLEE